MYSILIIALLCVPALGFDSSSSSSDSSSSEECCLKELIVFGDSYSDTGNVYRLTGQTYPISPPYYEGRYSNGPNWVDRLQVKYKKSYAYGSATTDNTVVVGLTNFFQTPVPGIRQQVATYLSETRSGKVKSHCRVHVIWGIGNDFVFKPTSTPVGSVNSLMNSVKDLLNAGVKNLVVFNGQPANLLPFSRTPGQSPSISLLLTIAINNLITGNLTTIKANYPKSTIHLFNVHELLTMIITDTTSTTFTNRFDPCWSINSPNPAATACSNPDQYVFVDLFHVSAPVQQSITDAFQPFFSCRRSRNTPIPYFTRF